MNRTHCDICDVVVTARPESVANIGAVRVRLANLQQWSNGSWLDFDACPICYTRALDAVIQVNTAKGAK